jgi:hypothetical protein
MLTRRTRVAALALRSIIRVEGPALLWLRFGCDAGMLQRIRSPHPHEAILAIGNH